MMVGAMPATSPFPLGRKCLGRLLLIRGEVHQIGGSRGHISHHSVKRWDREQVSWWVPKRLEVMAIIQ